ISRKPDISAGETTWRWAHPAASSTTRRTVETFIVWPSLHGSEPDRQRATPCDPGQARDLPARPRSTWRIEHETPGVHGDPGTLLRRRVRRPRPRERVPRLGRHRMGLREQARLLQ